MKISSAFPSNYIKAADLQDRNVRVVMGRVNIEEIGEDKKPVLYFQGKEKGLVLNKTNATNIAAAYGDDTDGWDGKEIILFSTWVDFQGKSVEAVRCRAPQAKDNKPNAKPQGNDMPDDEIPF